MNEGLRLIIYCVCTFSVFSLIEAIALSMNKESLSIFYFFNICIIIYNKYASTPHVHFFNFKKEKLIIVF